MKLGIAQPILQLHPPNFQNQYIFWSYSYDFSKDIYAVWVYKKHSLKIQEAKKQWLFKFLWLRNANHEFLKINGLKGKKYYLLYTVVNSAAFFHNLNDSTFDKK